MASLAVNPIFSSRTNANNTSFNPNKPNSPFLLFVSSPAHHLSQKSIDLKTKICCAYSRHPEYIPNRIPDDSFVRVFDTTLRDGEQSPGATMTREEKLAIARKLAKLGVDVIEAGFPASSKDDFEAVKMIAKEVGNAVDESGYVPVICGLSRCIRGDVDATWEAVKYAKRPRVHIFIATSEIHMKYKLNKTEDEIGRIVREIVSHARSLGFVDIEFSSEDAGRSDKEFLYRIFGEAIEAGATTVNFADTVGCNFPNEWGQFIADMKANVPGIENAILSTHCHNDLGLSTANTLAAVHAGARQVEVTVNGIGERAGNASLEEVVMAVKSRGKDLLGGLYTGIDTKHIVMTSKMVEEYSGLSVQPHKAIVGANAFAHASGIHQDGVLKHKGTYEIISPNDIGLLRSSEHGIVLGKLSGRHGLKSRLQELGYELDGKKLDDIFLRFKAIAERKKYISDSDIESLVSDETFEPQAIWKLGDMQVSCGTNGLSTATVKLIDVDGLEHIACAVGTGPVNAAYNAIDIIVKVPVTLLEYTMNSATEGIDGVASTRVVIRRDNNKTSLPEIVSGSGAGMDMVVSSARAYMNALNKMLGIKKGTSSKVFEESSQVVA